MAKYQQSLLYEHIIIHLQIRKVVWKNYTIRQSLLKIFNKNYIPNRVTKKDSK